VGIGLPSAACNLARLTHAPAIVLIYESGTVGTRPNVLPLSIGDGELAETAACIVPLPEVFAYLLQAGRVDVGFLGAAQIDRFGNLNSTVIGEYGRPRTRLPGAGGGDGHHLVARPVAHAASRRLARNPAWSRLASTCRCIQVLNASRSRAIASQRW
jgi:glutaconate CoA-transferase subunit B